MKMLSIDYSRHHTYVIAANLLVVAAYPNPEHEFARAKSHAQLCAIALRESRLELAQAIHLYSPNRLHAALAQRKFDIGKRFWRGFTERNRMAAVVTPTMLKLIANTRQAPTKLPTLKSMFEQYAESYKPDLDRTNFSSRELKRSLPVLPLMLGFRSVLQVDGLINDPDLLRRFFFDPTVSKQIIAHASYYRPLVMQQWGNRITPEDLWTFRDVTPN